MIDAKLLRSPRNSLKELTARASWALVALFGLLNLQSVDGAETVAAGTISGDMAAPDLITSASFLGGLGVLLFTHMLRSSKPYWP